MWRHLNFNMKRGIYSLRGVRCGLHPGSELDFLPAPWGLPSHARARDAYRLHRSEGTGTH